MGRGWAVLKIFGSGAAILPWAGAGRASLFPTIPFLGSIQKMCNTYNQNKANSLSIEGESLENHQHRPETSQDWKLNNDLTLPHMIRMIRIFSRIFWQKQKNKNELPHMSSLNFLFCLIWPASVIRSERFTLSQNVIDTHICYNIRSIGSMNTQASETHYPL